MAVDKVPAAGQSKNVLNKETESVGNAETWRKQEFASKKLPGYYLRLSKIRLTGKTENLL